MGKIKKILENELIGGTQSTDVYPVTSTQAVYDENNRKLSDFVFDKNNIVNNLTTGGLDKALSAEMGKELGGKVRDIASSLSMVVSGNKIDDKTLTPLHNDKYIYKGSGKLINVGGADVSGYISLKKGQKLFVTIPEIVSQNAAAIAVAKADGTFYLTSEKGVESVVGEKEYEFTPTEDCDVCVCYRASSGFTAMLVTVPLSEELSALSKELSKELSNKVDRSELDSIEGGSGANFPTKPKIEEIDFAWQAGYIRNNGVIQSMGYHYRIDGVQEGDEFHVLSLTTQSAYSAYPVMFVKNDDTIEAGPYETGAGAYSLNNASVQCTANTKAIIFNSRYNDRPLAKTIGNAGVVEYNNISEQITTDLRPILAEVEELVIEEGKAVLTATVEQSPTFTNRSEYSLYSLDVSEGEKYLILYKNTSPMQWAAVSSFNLTIKNNNNITGFQYIEIPKFATKLYLNVENNNNSNVVPPILKVVGYTPYEYDWRRYKWDAIGDSLTDKTINALYKYHYYTKIGTGIDVNVLGKGGAGYWRTNGDITFRTLAESVREDSDIVTIFGSINDWIATSSSNAIPNGEPSDTIDANTLSGYINATIDKVMEKAPNAMVVLVSAMFYNGITKTRQEELVDTLRKVAEYRLLPFVDMYHTTMFSRITEATFGAAYTTDYSETSETYGHPSDLAHYKFIFPRFVSVLAEHLPILNLMKK